MARTSAALVGAASADPRKASSSATTAVMAVDLPVSCELESLE
jgi:hypothetical protein